MKKILKNRIFLCVITAITFGTIGVSAATYFASSQVTYDNTESGLNSNNVQGAIDELYLACSNSSQGAEIIESSGLKKDLYEDRYFFTGATPNNYITFNNELWRIVSIESDGTIKIIRNESIGNMAWDTSNSNNWARPASLNTYLNETYYNELNTTDKSKIVSKEWNIGGVTNDNNDIANQINDENSSKWNGKVGLSIVSEYIRTTSGMYNCTTLKLFQDNYNICKNTTWMLNSNVGSWWTLTPYTIEPTGIDFVFLANTSGIFSSGMWGVRDESFGVRPSVYLSSEITLSGSGTISDPYIIQ